MPSTNPLNDIRRNNILHLLKYFELERHELAVRMGISYVQLNGYLRPNNPKGIGHKTVSKFENALNLEVGELNTDLSEKYSLSENDDEPMKTLPPLSNDGPVNQIIDQQILVVPLFLSNIDNGDFNPRKEPCIEKAFLKVSTVFEFGINPNHVKAIMVTGKWPTTHKTIFYIDTSVTCVDPFNICHYLIAMDGFRQIKKLDLHDHRPNMKILGRAFYVEQPLVDG